MLFCILSITYLSYIRQPPCWFCTMVAEPSKEVFSCIGGKIVRLRAARYAQDGRDGIISIAPKYSVEIYCLLRGCFVKRPYGMVGAFADSPWFGGWNDAAPRGRPMVVPTGSARRVRRGRFVSEILLPGRRGRRPLRFSFTIIILCKLI